MNRLFGVSRRTGMPRLVTGVVCWAVLLILSSCSVGRLVCEETVKQEAVMRLTDSTQYTGKVLLPDFSEKRIRFVTSSGQRVRLSADRVAWISFRHEGKWDGSFVRVPYVDRGGRERRAAWMNCLGRGPHLRIMLLGRSWQFDRKGRLVAVSFADGDVYIMASIDGGTARYVLTLGRTRTAVGHALCKMLADDPVLCRQIVSGEVDAFDFQEICRRYLPRQSEEENYYQVDAGRRGDWQEGGEA